jgi:hypothetical protein
VDPRFSSCAISPGDYAIINLILQRFEDSLLIATDFQVFTSTHPA